MKNKINEANKYECVLCETGEGTQHGLQCSCNKSEAITREDFFIFAQEEWENLGNSTQANEELIHICFNAMKHFTGIKEA